MKKIQTVLKQRVAAYGYGIGEFGFTFFNFFVAYYLMYYLTDVLLLPIGVAAFLYSAIQWVEGILMLVAGVLIDRSASRAGKYRPWVLWGSVLCAVSSVLFYMNFHVGTTAAVVLFAIFYTVCYMGYNVMWVGFRTLLDPMSKTPEETILNASASAQMGSLAGVVFSVIGTRLLYGFPTIQAGYTVSALIYGFIMVACMSIVCIFAGKKDVGSVPVEQAPPPSIRELLRSINGQFLVLFFAVTFREAANTILPTLLVYYFDHVIGDPSWMDGYMLIITFTGLFGYFISPSLAIRFGKKKMFLFSCAIGALALLMVNMFGHNKILFMSMMVIYTFGGLFSGGMIPVFMNDLAVFNESNYGVRGHAFSSSIGGCAIRFSQVIGGALAAFGLARIGYRAETEFTSAMGGRITGLMTFGCIAVLFVSAVFISMYKLEGDTLSKAYKKEKSA